MKRASAIGCFVVIVLGLIGALYLTTQIPEVSEQMPPNASPIIVTLAAPPNDAAIPLNDATPISVDAIGPQPIVAVELWVDGVRLFSKTSDAGLAHLTAVWSWTPASEGTHTLMARALDAQQREGQSNVVRVVASKDANPTTQIAYKTQPGDTLPVIAQKFQVPPQQVIDANPQINPNNPIPAGQDVAVPVPDTSEPGPGVDDSTPDPSSSNPPPPLPDPGQGAPPGQLDKNIFWIKALADLFSKSNPPAKPILGAVVNGCNVKLTIADQSFNEDGFYIQRDGSNPSLKPIATLGAHNGASSFGYTDSDLAQGQYVYYVVAFNPAGNALSNPVQVKIADSQCQSPIDWGKVFQAIKMITTQPLDKVYCYLKMGNGDWQRIPHAPNTFLSPNQQGAFDVGAYLKSLPLGVFKSKMTVELDCWGWKGNQLIYLGNAKQTVGPGQLLMKGDQFEFTGVLPAGFDSPIGGIPVGITPSPEQFLEGGLPSLMPPSGLKNTNDPKECTAHMPGVMAILGGEFACKAAMDDGNHAVLVWEWLGGCWPGDSNCVKTIDGYRVYREDFPAPSLVKEVQGQDLKTAMFPLPPEPWPPESNAPLMWKLKYAALAKNCYFVRAFKDGVGESPDSQKICLPWQAFNQIKDLTPANVLTRGVWHAYTEYHVWDGPASICAQGLAGPDVQANQIQVGYYHATWDNCNGYYNLASRGAVYFDLSNIPKNAFLNWARLEYDFPKNVALAFDDTATNQKKINCATRLMLGKEEWMGKNFGSKVYWIPGESYLTLASTLGTFAVKPGQPDIQLDVTDAVKQWIQGSHPNYGFVFRSGSEGLDHEDNNRCLANYGNFHLKLSYQVP